MKNFTTHFSLPRLLLGVGLAMLVMAPAQAAPQPAATGIQRAPLAVPAAKQADAIRLAWDRVGAPVHGIQTTV